MSCVPLRTASSVDDERRRDDLDTVRRGVWVLRWLCRRQLGMGVCVRVQLFLSLSRLWVWGLPAVLYPVQVGVMLNVVLVSSTGGCPACCCCCIQYRWVSCLMLLLLYPVQVGVLLDVVLVSSTGGCPA